LETVTGIAGTIAFLFAEFPLHDSNPEIIAKYINMRVILYIALQI
jgi:hypothetical protein